MFMVSVSVQYLPSPKLPRNPKKAEQRQLCGGNMFGKRPRYHTLSKTANFQYDFRTLSLNT